MSKRQYNNRDIITFQIKKKNKDDIEHKNIQSTLKGLYDKIQLEENQELRLLENILYYESDGRNPQERPYKKSRRSYQMIKVAVVIAILFLIGSGTVIASQYIFKAETVHRGYKSLKEYEEELDSTTIMYTTYEERVVKYYSNNMLSYPSDQVKWDEIENEPIEHKKILPTHIETHTYDSSKLAGEAAFMELNMLNLIPDYLYDNYYLTSPGIEYEYLKSTDNAEFRSLVAVFHKEKNATKFGKGTIRVEYLDVKIFGFTSYISEERTMDSFTTTLYTNKGGVECEIVEENGQANVVLVFDSEDKGKGTLFLSFYENSMEDIKKVLDEIPYLGRDMVINED